jgi:proteasome lid subunit RPN8/RPN11
MAIELTPNILGAIHHLAMNAAPNEAVGIIAGGLVSTLRNASLSPRDSFAVDLGELKQLILATGIPLENVNEEVVLWHSHPAGGVGPSRFDMQNRTPLKHHLVVSLVDDTVVPTWY